MILKLVAVLGVLSLAACAPAAISRFRKPPRPQADLRRELDARLRSKPSPAILFVGNSYSFGVPAALKKVAAEHGKTVRAGHSVHSGWTLAKHSKDDGTLGKIRSGNWDIVVLQEYSQTPAMPFWWRNHTMFPPLRQLAAEVRQAGAIPILYQTWGRRDGDHGHRILYPGDNFQRMSSRVRNGYRAASDSAGGMLIVPVGDDWEKQVAAGRAGELFLPDGSHPTAAGNRLTAEAFYRFLFR